MLKNCYFWKQSVTCRFFKSATKMSRTIWMAPKKRKKSKWFIFVIWEAKSAICICYLSSEEKLKFWIKIKVRKKMTNIFWPVDLNVRQLATHQTEWIKIRQSMTRVAILFCSRTKLGIWGICGIERKTYSI